MLPPGVLDRLNLTEEQRAAVDEVLVRRREDTEAVLQAVYPQLRAQVDSASMEIRALLTPEQQETFDRLREEFPPLGSIRRGDGGPRPPRD
jgi:Spy/CpxP family protein refolding chaperone